MAYSTSYRPRFTVDYGVVGVAAGLYLALIFYPVTQASFPELGSSRASRSGSSSGR